MHGALTHSPECCAHESVLPPEGVLPNAASCFELTCDWSPVELMQALQARGCGTVKHCGERAPQAGLLRSAAVVLLRAYISNFQVCAYVYCLAQLGRRCARARLARTSAAGARARCPLAHCLWHSIPAHAATVHRLSHQRWRAHSRRAPPRCRRTTDGRTRRLEALTRRRARGGPPRRRRRRTCSHRSSAKRPLPMQPRVRPWPSGRRCVPPAVLYSPALVRVRA